MSMKSDLARVTPRHLLIACAFGAIFLSTFWGGYQTGKAVAGADRQQTQSR